MSSVAPFTDESAGPNWEKTENPQAYGMTQFVYTSPEPRRHELGLIAGNNVSHIAGNMIDLESDLRGITRPNTFAPWRQYQPPPKSQKEIVRDNTKIQLKIDVQKAHLPAYQMWAYPGMPTPAPIKNEVCKNPEKY
jgi:hypothetical protein